MSSRPQVVIVGSGPVGSAYAREILDTLPSARVVMLEAGPLLTDPPGLHVGNVPDPDDRVTARRRAQGDEAGMHRVDASFIERAGALTPGAPPHLVERSGMTPIDRRIASAPDDVGLPAAGETIAVGGMGVLWTASCPRPRGSERPAVVPPDEFDACLGRAEELLQVDETFNAASPANTCVREALARVFDPETPDAPVRPLPMAARLTGGVISWSGTDVVLGDAVSSGGFELRPDTVAREVLIDAGRVTGVRAFDRVRDVEVVVPADAVVVAANAFRSPQLLFASGIRSVALGRYLNDHIHMMAAVRVRGDAIPELPVGGTWVPFVEGVRPFHGQILQMGVSPAQIDARGFGAAGPNDVLSMSWYARKEIHAEDRVEFDPLDLDGFGLPRMSIHYRITDTDREQIARLSATMVRAAAALGDMLHPEPLLMPWGNSAHYHGTTRMGADPADSVVDAHGQVWGIDGLFVGGNNVIATSTTCNSTLHAVALAIGGARRLVEMSS